jgi:hypothetical protein
LELLEKFQVVYRIFLVVVEVEVMGHLTIDQVVLVVEVMVDLVEIHKDKQELQIQVAVEEVFQVHLMVQTDLLEVLV